MAGLSYLRPDLLSFRWDTLVSHCEEDDEIPSDDRKLIEGDAVALVRRVLSNDAKGAFAQFSQEGKSATPLDSLQAGVNTIRADGPFGPPTITRSYLVDLEWGQGHGEPALCDGKKDAGGGDVPTLGTAAKQAEVVVVTADTKGQQSFTVSMHADGTTWQVDGFRFHPVTASVATAPVEK